MKRAERFKEIAGVASKFCNFCNIYHPINKDHWYFSGKNTTCKKKAKEYSKKEETLVRRRIGNISPEAKEKRRASQKKNRTKINPEKRLGYNRKYTSRPEIKEKRRGYTKKESYRKYKRDWIKKRMREDPVFRIKCYIRKRISRSARKICNEGLVSNIRSADLFGCDLAHLKSHLQSLFRDGMSWENYGEWEIDHIVPMVRFDLTNPEEIKKCNNFFNLQPLWKTENASKGGK